MANFIKEMINKISHGDLEDRLIPKEALYSLRGK